MTDQNINIHTELNIKQKMSFQRMSKAQWYSEQPLMDPNNLVIPTDQRYFYEQ